MSIHMVQPGQELWKTDDGYDIPNSGFKIYHVAGTVFKLEPNNVFAGELALYDLHSITFWCIRAYLAYTCRRVGLSLYGTR